LRKPKDDRRYRLLLMQYKQPSAKPVTSCLQLNNSQLEDCLAICESLGFRCPGKPANYFRGKAARARGGDISSFAQQSAIKHLAGDMGWSDEQLSRFIELRITGGAVSNIALLSSKQAYAAIEALKAILSRQMGKKYNSLAQVKNDMEVKHEQACKVG